VKVVDEYINHACYFLMNYDIDIEYVLNGSDNMNFEMVQVSTMEMVFLVSKGLLLVEVSACADHMITFQNTRVSKHQGVLAP
jgi:hypothetical protein